VRTLIEWAGDDPGREGLAGTPERVVRAYEEFFAGYNEDPVAVLTTTFEAAHQYMTTRGIRKPGASMVTSRMLGSFRDHRTTRQEFLSMIDGHRNAPHEC